MVTARERSAVTSPSKVHRVGRASGAAWRWRTRKDSRGLAWRKVRAGRLPRCLG